MGDMAVVAVFRENLEALEKALAQLAGQTKPVVVLLVNNTPELEDEFAEVVEAFANVEPFFGEEDRGRFARLESMHYYCNEYDYFLSLDLARSVDRNWALRWWQNRREDVIQGQSGYMYVEPSGKVSVNELGKFCHFVDGGNMMVPAQAVVDPGILELKKKFWQGADDVWLCCRAAAMGLRVRVVPSATKGNPVQTNWPLQAALIQELRQEGWPDGSLP